VDSGVNIYHESRQRTNMRALYISYNGMLENLGQSQVLPYVRGLARKGVEYDLFAFELSDAQPDAIRALQIELAGQGIRYHPLVRKRDPRLRTKVFESGKGVLSALATVVTKQPHVIHGRSYFPTAIGDLLQHTAPRAKLLFDCRGMLADEYVDCGYWTRDRPEYYLVKSYERRLFDRSHGIVVLTHALRDWLSERAWLPTSAHIEAIPCCVDTERFRFTPERRAEARQRLGLDAETCIVYSGSLGSWYLEQDMARFVGAAYARDPSVVFCAFSPSSTDNLRELTVAAGVPADRIRTMRVAPKDMPTMLAAGDIGLSFIQSCFSKKGSSPTKVAEYLAAGLTVVVNGDIGDQRDLAQDDDACVVLRSFVDREMEVAADRALSIAKRPIEERTRATYAAAQRHFGLENVGIARYERLYRALAEA
jgi:glycosyltransferase involved in cell wall biosynthesis